MSDEVSDLRAKLAAAEARVEMLLNQNQEIAASNADHVRWHREAEAQLAELYAIINDDGSLTTHEEHRDILRDAMSALNGLPAMQAALAAERERAERAWSQLEEPLVGALERGGPHGTVSISDLLIAVRALRKSVRPSAQEPSD